MKIIFLGSTGVHHTLVAANLYLDNMKPKKVTLIDGFDDSAIDFSGFPIYIKDDMHGNQVYTLGVGQDIQLTKKSIEYLVDILGFTADDLIVQPVHIKGERTLFLLNRISATVKFNSHTTFIAEKIINKEYNTIKANVEEFIKFINSNKKKVFNF
ncbi:hypothetical protein SYNTR_1243 [Candidatus Syntrophocurvum alkaliphilum]|uniref:Uncharacterized protein n=1 Tax=Candidatus Syntrophocurvum alkaliphilum TaxID=2293317 RepID=A0A6I6DF93_9FIRM|nr:DUF3189 family protein [Candidatus Syntrophocurvum alkaliphilum]QGT99836.1 hypothetical protein SYNTR_1243 [Candidatus Syntrophocurvum alkaliphilum]